ncbi:MAG: non-ribosomal peptide synthetase, partial [Acidobacteria bacterium]
LTAGRKQTELESLLGYFVNPLALRINVSGNPTFRELQSRVRSVVLDALAHEEVPFGEILRQIQFKQDPSRNPIFQIIFSQQPRLADIPPGWSLVTEEISNGGSKVDLVIVVDDRGEEISGPITYNPDLFQESTITRMVGHWETLLKAVCVNIDQPVARLPILTEAERNQILFEWNATHADYPNNICLHELIETQAEQTPDAEAVIYNEQRLTYRQLNARANQLAHRLRELGAGPEVLIGICMERSIEMVVALLGALKAGAAYLPLDPEYPKERLRIILDDSHPIVLLTQQRLLTQLLPCDLKVIALDSEWNQIASQSSSNPTRLAGPDNVAYAIYTSGSTGRPKGVLNIHRGIVNRLIWMQDAYSLTPDDRVLQKTPYSFDVSVWEFFWPLISGAALVIAKPGGHKDPDYLLALIQREKVTTTHFVPSMLQVFLEVDGREACHNLKRVICSGEALPYEVQKRFFARLQAELHNLYGPTEAAVDVTYWQCRPDSGDPIVPIGRPIANVQIYLHDENLQPVPIGVAGQLHIGGVALARGYLNRPELTAEKFIPDPFSAQPGRRLYKTWDLARYRADGNIEYLGRIDDQVKIRGFRIELGEIEAVLHEHPLVREARVVVHEDISGDRRLAAYIVCAEKADSGLQQLREYLSDKLPNYMVPAIIKLEKLPLTANGKLDRRALPPPELSKKQDTPVEETRDGSRDAVEQVLAEVWTEVLGIQEIGNYDNFFDLGGHSLTAIQVVARVKTRLGLQIKPRQLAFQTLAQLAAVCKEQLHPNEVS